MSISFLPAVSMGLLLLVAVASIHLLGNYILSKQLKQDFEILNKELNFAIEKSNYCENDLRVLKEDVRRRLRQTEDLRKLVVKKETLNAAIKASIEEITKNITIVM